LNDFANQVELLKLKLKLEISKSSFAGWDGDHFLFALVLPMPKGVPGDRISFSADTVLPQETTPKT